MKTAISIIFLFLASLASTPTLGTTTNLFDISGNMSKNEQAEKSQQSPEKTQSNNLSIEGSVSWQTFNNNTQVSIQVASLYNRRAGGSSGFLRLELWALSSVYNGGAASGYKLGQGTLNPLASGYSYSNLIINSAYTPPTQPGTYYVVLFVTEYSSSQPSNDGYGVVDWRNFSNTLIIGGTPGGGLSFTGPWTWAVTNGNLRVTAAAIVNNNSSGVSGSLRLELWALANPYTGGSFSGYKVGQSPTYSPLSAGYQYSNLDFTTTASIPPNGTWNMVLMLTEYSSSVTSNNGFAVVSYNNATTQWTVGTTPPPPTATVLQNGLPVAQLYGASGSSALFAVTVPVGARNLLIRTSGGSGDPDLYVRYGSTPTTVTYDCRSWAMGSTESCSFVTPSAGTYYIMVYGYNSYSGLTILATWDNAPPIVTIDEPGFSGFTLPLPNPPFPNCPGGYFVAAIEDGAAPGLTPGAFGLDLTLSAPGTQRLEGGLNFGGLLDGSQVAFAGFNFINPANELQRLDIILNGNPAYSRSASLPVRIKLIRQPAAGVNELVLETTAILSQAQQVIQTVNLTPSFYVITIAPEGSASVPGGAADGEVYVSLATQFINRPGGGFFGGAVVGGYHAQHPFGGVSGFASFCIATQHIARAQVYSAPSYGPTGARDLQLRLIDHVQREVIRVP